MWLINVHTLNLEYFFDNIPPYAILSHTWGDEEVTFHDIRDGREFERQKIGFGKIFNCCQLAKLHNCLYVWVDTCCIDKTSSAELSEAINSMYQWYQDAAVCYVYLNDITAKDPLYKDKLGQSRWFTRGWTLQELLAPSNVIFFDKEWTEMGTKSSLRATISAITTINETVLATSILDGCTVRERMSWASHRMTTRIEDAAYCLLGIFNVNMPLLYGEGMAAFVRLQQAILGQEEDYSIFLWSPQGDPSSYYRHGYGILSSTPSCFSRTLKTRKYPETSSSVGTASGQESSLCRVSLFENPDRVRNCPEIFTNGISHLMSEPPLVTNRGLSVTFNKFTLKWRSLQAPGAVFVWTFQMIGDHFVCLTLTPHQSGMDTVYTRHGDLQLVSKEAIEKAELKRYFVTLKPIRQAREGRHEFVLEEPVLSLSGVTPSLEMMTRWDRLLLENSGPKASRPPAIYQLDMALSMVSEQPTIIPIAPEPKVTEIFHVSPRRNTEFSSCAVIIGFFGEVAWTLVLELQERINDTDGEALSCFKSTIEKSIRLEQIRVLDLSDQDSLFIGENHMLIAKIKPGNPTRGTPRIGSRLHQDIISISVVPVTGNEAGASSRVRGKFRLGL